MDDFDKGRRRLSATFRSTKLYMDDFDTFQTWIDVCKGFGVILDKEGKCKKTGYAIGELRFKASDIEAV